MQECMLQSQSMCSPTSISQSISLYLFLLIHFHDNLHGGEIL